MCECVCLCVHLSFVTHEPVALKGSNELSGCTFAFHCDTIEIYFFFSTVRFLLFAVIVTQNPFQWQWQMQAVGLPVIWARERPKAKWINRIVMVGGGAAGQSNQNRKQRKAPVDFGKGKGVPVTRPESLLHPLQYTHTHIQIQHILLGGKCWLWEIILHKWLQKSGGKYCIRITIGSIQSCAKPFTRC